MRCKDCDIAAQAESICEICSQLKTANAEVEKSRGIIREIANLCENCRSIDDAIYIAGGRKGTSTESGCEKCWVDRLQAKLERHRWIPVSERLPEETEEDLRPEVLVYDGESVTGALWRHYGSGWAFETDRGTPTHWKPMDLPEQCLKNRP